MKKLALSLLLIGVLSACQPQKEEVATVACDSDVVKSTFDLGTKQQIMAKLKYLAQAQPEVYGSLNFSQIEQALDSIQFNLESIHTESKPTDTPQMCQADVVVSIPNDVVIAAQLKANELNQTFNLAAEAFQAEMAQGSSGFYQTEVKYQVSGEADTKSPMVRSDADTKLTQFLLRLLTMGQLKTATPSMASDVLSTPSMELDMSGNASAPRSASDPEQVIQDLADQAKQSGYQPGISGEEIAQNQRERNRSEAQVEQMWAELPNEVQQTLDQQQSQWRNKRSQSCQQAASGGGSDAERQNILASCEAKANRERLNELKQYHVPN